MGDEEYQEFLAWKRIHARVANPVQQAAVQVGRMVRADNSLTDANSGSQFSNPQYKVDIDAMSREEREAQERFEQEQLSVEKFRADQRMRADRRDRLKHVVEEPRVSRSASPPSPLSPSWRGHKAGCQRT